MNFAFRRAGTIRAIVLLNRSHSSGSVSISSGFDFFGGFFAIMDINEEQIAFYSEIGHAITQWAYVQFALAWIVATRFEKKNTQNAIDGFLSIENMRAKLQYHRHTGRDRWRCGHSSAFTVE